jgi:hypothetical protein
MAPFKLSTPQIHARVAHGRARQPMGLHKACDTIAQSPIRSLQYAEKSGQRSFAHFELKTKTEMPPTSFACGTSVHFCVVTET